MDQHIRISADGSQTVYSAQFDEHYHSLHGAVQESMHVFIRAGLQPLLQEHSQISILEVGFGTGLNCLLTLLENKSPDMHIHYTTLEAFPLDAEVIAGLDYSSMLENSPAGCLKMLHEAPWGVEVKVAASMTLLKLKVRLEEFRSDRRYDLVYFDAFSPGTQPELWTPEIFSAIYGMMTSGGMLVSYCSKGQVKRNLKAAGFRVEALQGPPGKREMTRAVKDIK